MRTPYMALVLLVSACAGPAAMQPAPAKITNYEVPGNLQARNGLRCLKAEALKNTYTAADLYRSDVQCVKEKDFDSAIYVSALAGVYGRYDSMRVADRSAHQAQTVLNMNFANSLTEEERKQFRAQMVKVALDPSSLAGICSKIRSIGPPDYYPAYMIQHGMGALMGTKGNGLVSGFDSAAAWEKTLATYLHCDKP